MTQQFVCLPAEVLQAGLSTGATKALLGLLSFRNHETGQCNPKIEKLCERLGGTSDATVRRWLRELRQVGIVVAEKHKGKSNCYRLLCAVKNDRTEAPCAVKNDRTVRSKMTGQPSASLYELDKGNNSVGARKRAPAAALPRKSIERETLERYYAEERRKAAAQ